jgi:hypothetical protein
MVSRVRQSPSSPIAASNGLIEREMVPGDRIDAAKGDIADTALCDFLLLLFPRRQDQISHGVDPGVEMGEDHRSRIILIDDRWTLKSHPRR